MTEYRFFGWEQAGRVVADCSEYSGIATPIDLYDRLSGIWCADTCAPRLRDKWSPADKTLGQCSITAFLAQDIFGGQVYAIPTGNGLHCYNKVGDIVFDLTSEQFGDRAGELVYDCSLLQERESEAHFYKPEKRARYEYLKKELAR